MDFRRRTCSEPRHNQEEYTPSPEPGVVSQLLCDAFQKVVERLLWRALNSRLRLNARGDLVGRRIADGKIEPRATLQIGLNQHQFFRRDLRELGIGRRLRLPCRGKVRADFLGSLLVNDNAAHQKISQALILAAHHDRDDAGQIKKRKPVDGTHQIASNHFVHVECPASIFNRPDSGCAFPGSLPAP
jgi:hypothetical protein